MSAQTSKFRLPEPLRIGAATPEARSTRQLLLFATLLTLVLNFVPYSNVVLYPLRLFVTFVHESGHALATLLVGGGVVSLAVSPDGSGLTQSVGSSFATAWLIDSAGYLGTTLFGALLLQLGRVRLLKSARLPRQLGGGEMNAGRLMLYACALFMLAIMVWVRDPFTLITGLGIAAIFWFLAQKASPRVAEFVAMFLAVQCSLNALVDIRVLLQLSTSRPEVHTDALNMQHMYLLPAALWAFLWAIGAVCMLTVSLWSYLRATSNP